MGPCTKTNIEIIQECEESAKANSDSPDSVTEVEIPSELKLGYKDEMTESKGSEGGSTEAVTPVPPTPRTEPVDAESAELAEGFVRTAPETVAAAPSSASTSQSPATAASYPPAHPGQGIIAPTRTVSLPPAPNLSVRPQAPPTTRAYDEGVPLWVDRAIVVLVVLLLAMILKVLLDF
ncbi:hypothetical protein COL5a_000902 [Colletotrichum fioriniae]|uniref:uncharacterized protein n=1 Tax=Colletotrichum fioriniae TaxID=710243 RepID=UPI0032D9CEE9|nr:hypothetical protein COL5a_000902 [Colletotrichum fioriniae]KAJ3947485.1 hypothetical protein N0V96_003876 [Colletotrichum fioriniae]